MFHWGYNEVKELITVILVKHKRLQGNPIILIARAVFIWRGRQFANERNAFGTKAIPFRFSYVK